MKRKHLIQVCIYAILILMLASCNPEKTTPTERPATSLPPTATLTVVPTATSTATATPVPIPYPPARGYHGLIYDDESDIVILFGGQPNETKLMNDAWSYQPRTNTWTQIPNSFKANFTQAYDSESDRVIYYLSASLKGMLMISVGRTMAYDFNNLERENMAPDPIPFGYLGSRIAYDSESDRIILFGGLSLDTGKYFDETWSYDFNTNTWVNLNPALHPTGRNFHGMAYIPSIDRVFLYGGVNASGDQTWTYDYNSNTWSQVNVLTQPPSIDYNAMTYVSSIDRVFMFGGVSLSSGSGLQEDVWVFNPETMDWSMLDSDPNPSGRAWHAMTYDAATDQVILFGGGPDKEAFSNELWIYDVQSNTWSDLTPSN